MGRRNDSALPGKRKKHSEEKEEQYMRKAWKKLCLALLLTLLFVSGVPSVSQNFGVIRTEAAGTVGLSKTKLTAIEGKKYKIVLRNRKRDTRIQWSSSKKSIATVSGSGTTCEITAKKSGNHSGDGEGGRKNVSVYGDCQKSSCAVEPDDTENKSAEGV